ncbi:hypothetical protein [Deinococcus roseus]|uniref:SnoaL-like domain-containing protein n=1 Tax=Deinococcus roseus TaxID=392414 RepID=A0ABQ2DBL3_9DEIO|nr:hypothetical protein [Deinococcus roseus]GGJ52156.1 hypothetical protein GCM10008938_42710 [Deinococcus roseus]
MSISDTEIQGLVQAWFSGLNEHRAMVKMMPLLDLKNLHMVFPESTLTTPEEFENWYRTVTSTFFDQDHIIEEVSSDIQENGANVKVTVIWKAHEWKAPAAFSTRIAMRAAQDWQVVRDENGQVVIQRYVVNSLTPVES